METAYPIASKLELDVIPRNGLLEIDFGDWQNKKLKNLSKLDEWKIVQGNPSRMRFPGGESFHEAQQRVVAEIDELVDLHEKDKAIVCVSHSDVIKLAVAFYIGLPLDLFQRLHIAPASITVIYISNTGSRLLALNYESSFTLIK